MEQTKLESLQRQLAGMQKQAVELRELAGDFPAFDKNLVRIEASLNMMAIALGGSVLDES